MLGTSVTLGIKCYAGYDMLEMRMSYWGSSVMLDMTC